MICLYLIALFNCNLGIEIFIQNKYNPFQDTAIVLMGFFWVIIFVLIKNGTIWLGLRLNIWGVEAEAKADSEQAGEEVEN